MSERGAGSDRSCWPGLGAVLGSCSRPSRRGVRTKLSRKLRGLRDLAAEKAGKLGELLDTGEDEETKRPPRAWRSSDGWPRRSVGAWRKGQLRGGGG